MELKCLNLHHVVFVVTIHSTDAHILWHFQNSWMFQQMDEFVASRFAICVLVKILQRTDVRITNKEMNMGTAIKRPYCSSLVIT